MRLGNPWGLLALGLTAPLVLWYLLRSRRPRMTVSSTFLWQQAQRSVAAAVPWQRFRPDLTFWLVLAAIVAGALALAHPYLPVPAVLGDHTILLVDASGSMLADEEGPTRLELARREADALVDTMSPGQEVSVVEAGARARVLLSASPDAGAVRDALRSVRLGHGPADLDDAFTLAAALQRPGQDTVLHLLTDGELPAEVRATAPPGLRVTAVGAPRPNLAITRLQAVPVGAGSSQVFVEVRNFGQQEAAAELSLTVAGDEVVSERFRLPPRGTDDRVLSVTGGEGDVLSASVSPVGQDVAGAARTDALTVDDQAFALLASPREVAVVLATPGNVFLEAALGAVPGSTVEVVDQVPRSLDDVDLLVVDRLPAPSPAPVPTLMVAPTIWPDGITAEEEVEQPSLSFQAGDHELLADVDLSEVAVAAATPLASPGLVPLAGGPQGDLVLAGRLEGVPVVAVGFDLLRSNLPLAATWPILVANTTSWLAGPPTTVPAQAGDTVEVPVVDGADRVTVTSPSGDERVLDVAAPRLTVDQVGLWRLAYAATDDAELPPGAPAIAVNPVGDEGDLARPAPEPVAVEEPAGDGEVEDVAAGAAAEGRDPVGPLVLVAVLVLAVAEWLWVHALRPWRRRRRAARRGAAGPGTGSTPPRVDRPAERVP
jgi:hypothetical protein